MFYVVLNTTTPEIPHAIVRSFAKNPFERNPGEFG